MQCPNCQHEAPDAEFGTPAKCPSCGAYYTKALARAQIKPKPKPAPKQTDLSKRLINAHKAVKDRRSNGELLCTRCGTRSNGKTVAKGSILIELILWLAFLIPGLIYSLWRLTTKHNACPACGSSDLIPANSPRAKQLGL